jgi:hypothetical protein
VKRGTNASFQKKVKKLTTNARNSKGRDRRDRLMPEDRMAVISRLRDSIPSENKAEKRAANSKTEEIKKGDLYKKYLTEAHRGASYLSRLSIRSKKSTTKRKNAKQSRVMTKVFMKLRIR